MRDESSSLADDQDPLAKLRQRIQELHLHSGEPSTRMIAKQTHAISHTTVSKVLQCITAPRWGQLEVVVQVLGGDVESFRQDRIAIRHAAKEAASDE
jgi:hypothetical protein